MGIENRGYMQEDPPTSLGGNSFGSGSVGAFENIVKTLIIINVVVFLAQSLFVRNLSFEEFLPYTNAPTEGFSTEKEEQAYRDLYEQEKLKGFTRQPVLEQWLILDADKVMQGQVWRLLTYAFLHSTDSITHILFNMLLLYMAGTRLQYQIGTREFLAFYLLSCILSGLFYLLWGGLTDSMGNALGASGAVSAVMLVYALHWPNERWLLFMIFPTPVIVVVLLYAAYDIMPMLQQLAGRGGSDHVAHAAHVGGLLFGYLYFRNRWRVLNWIPEFSTRFNFKRKPKLKIHRPETEPVPQKQPIPRDVADRVDVLLAKIHSEGEAALTEEERTFLAEASRKYRDR